MTIAVAEGLLRVPAIAASLPPPESTLWHSDLIQSKVDFLTAFEAERGVDVLFIGNSSVQAGLDPSAFDRARGREDASGPGAFNASLEGLPPHAVLQFLDVFLRHSSPRVIIFGLTAQDLNSNSVWARDMTDRVTRSPMIAAQMQDGWQGWITAGLLEHSQLFRYRFVLFRVFLDGKIKDPPFVYFDTRGFHPLEARLSDLPPAKRGMTRHRASFADYSTEGLQLNALRSLVALCNARGIEVILVNMPLSDDYRTNVATQQHYQKHVATLHRVAAESQIQFLNFGELPQGLSFRDTEFADLNHLNQHGATRLSQMVGEQYLGLRHAKLSKG